MGKSRLSGLTGDFDVMIEAKMKDMALFKLMEDMKNYDFVKKTGDAWIEIQ